MSAIGTTAWRALSNEGGFTIDPQTGASMSGANWWAVSRKGYEVQLWSCPSVSEIDAYLETYRQLFFEEPAPYIGGWRQSEDGPYFLDITDLVVEREDAVLLALLNAQKAIYHLGTGEEVVLAAEALRL